MSHSLLLVKDDVFSFSSLFDEGSLLNLKCMPLGETKSNARIAGRNNLYIVTETPIVAFINNAFHLQEAGSNRDCSRFWKRVNRWIHADLSSQETLNGSSEEANNVNSRILNYSVYHRVYKYSYFLCTCMTWFMVVLVLLLNLTSFQFSDLRLLLVTFFICPLTVAVLESAYEGAYVIHLVGYWYSMKVTSEMRGDD